MSTGMRTVSVPREAALQWQAALLHLAAIALQGPQQPHAGQRAEIVAVLHGQRDLLPPRRDAALRSMNRTGAYTLRICQ
jgi:hypothetical protein